MTDPVTSEEDPNCLRRRLTPVANVATRRSPAALTLEFMSRVERAYGVPVRRVDGMDEELAVVLEQDHNLGRRRGP